MNRGHRDMLFDTAHELRLGFLWRFDWLDEMFCGVVWRRHRQTYAWQNRLLHLQQSLSRVRGSA